LLSGWNIYLDLCTRMPNADCKTDAEAGLAEARRRFGVDTRTDQLPSTSLFGRLHRE
jgi:hypothetical protein